MSDLVQGRSKYSDEDRRKAVVEYCVLGNMLKVSEVTGIPDTTLAHWKNKSDWWESQVAVIREEINEQILSDNLKIATKAAERVLDALENGDEKLVVDKETGRHVVKRVKPSAKDCMVINGIAQDKGQRQMGLPTHIHGQAADTQIKAFIEEFRHAAESYTEKQATVVATQEKLDEAPA